MPDWWRGGLGPGAVHKWAKARGFATGRDDPEPRISAWALRQTVLERKGTPITHTAQVMNDRYLTRSGTVQAESRKLSSRLPRRSPPRRNCSATIPGGSVS